jgi:hypothetical protein
MMDKEEWIAQRPKFTEGQQVSIKLGSLVGVVGKVEWVYTRTFQTVGMTELPVILYSYSVKYENGASVEASEEELQAEGEN